MTKPRLDWTFDQALYWYPRRSCLRKEIVNSVMSIARTVTILETDCKDFTSNTYNKVYAISEYSITILVSCTPLLRLLTEQFGFFSFSNQRNA